MNKPLVTVVTPVYNAEEFIQRTIDSVASQNYLNVEYLLINDCTPDKSQEIAILPSFARWIRNEVNLGEAASVNRGFELAQGKYVLVLSADDLISKSLLDYAVEILENEEEIVAVYPNWEIIDAYDGLITKVETREYSQRELIEDFHCTPGPGCVFRNPTQFGVKRDANFKYVSDYDFWIRLSLHGKFKKIKYLGASWRKSDTGASFHRNLKMSDERINVIKKAFEIKEISDSLDQKKALSAAYYHAARLRLFNGNVNSFQLILKSFKLDKSKRTNSPFVRPTLLNILLFSPLLIEILKFAVRKSFLIYLLMQYLSSRMGLEIKDFLTYSLNEKIGRQKKIVKLSTSRKQTRVLLIGMFGSVHFQGWSKQVSTIFQNLKFLDSDASKYRISGNKNSIEFKKRSLISYYLKNFLKRLFGDYYQAARIHKSIRKNKPNIVHIHELQMGGYPMLYVLEHLSVRRDFSLYLSSWGSDLSYYGNLNSHKQKLGKLLSCCKILTVENEIEYKIARKLGYKSLPELQILNSGGIEVSQLPRPTARRGIVLKGYQDAHGRALSALAALSNSEYARLEPIWIYSASPEVSLYADYLKSTQKLDIEILSTVSNPVPKEQLRKYFNEAKIYIGNSISDGASTSMLEAMSSGCLVLQSTNSLADSLITPEVNGFQLIWWDTKQISTSIDQALINYQNFTAELEANSKMVMRNFNIKLTAGLITSLYSLENGEK